VRHHNGKRTILRVSLKERGIPDSVASVTSDAHGGIRVALKAVFNPAPWQPASLICCNAHWLRCASSTCANPPQRTCARCSMPTRLNTPKPNSMPLSIRTISSSCPRFKASSIFACASGRASTTRWWLRVLHQQKNRFLNGTCSKVLGEGLEPSRLTAPEPKSGVSANFTTRAKMNGYE
jgi:hypothetical protein